MRAYFNNNTQLHVSLEQSVGSRVGIGGSEKVEGCLGWSCIRNYAMKSMEQRVCPQPVRATLRRRFGETEERIPVFHSRYIFFQLSDVLFPSVPKLVSDQENREEKLRRVLLFLICRAVCVNG